MKKFVIVNKNKAERVVCCEDVSSIVCKPEDTIVEVDISRKVIKGEDFFVETKVVNQKKKRSYVPYIIGAGLIAAAVGYYFIAIKGV